MVEDIPLVGLAPANWFYPGQESAMSGAYAAVLVTVAKGVVTNLAAAS